MQPIVDYVPKDGLYIKMQKDSIRGLFNNRASRLGSQRGYVTRIMGNKNNAVQAAYSKVQL